MHLTKKQGRFEVFSMGVEEPWRILRDGKFFADVWTWPEVDAILAGGDPPAKWIPPSRRRK